MINIVGAADGRVAPIINHILKEKKGQSLIVVSTFNRAKRLAVDLSFFSEEKIYVLPPEDETMLQYEARSNEQLLERMKILKAVVSGESCIVIAPATGAVKKLPPEEIFADNIIYMERGRDICR